MRSPVQNTRWLRSRRDGWVTTWDPILAANPVMEEVPEEVAFPERFAEQARVRWLALRRRRGRPELLSLVLITEAQLAMLEKNMVYVGDPLLNEAASQRLPL